MKQIKIFCDFDGTITATDNIASIMKHFVPEQTSSIIKDILSQKLAIKDGVEAMFKLLRSSQKQEILQYLNETVVIREGFSEFVSFTRQHDIPLYIVSGGVDFFVEPLLAPFGPFTDIYCNASDLSGDVIQVLYPHFCDEDCSNFNTQACGCCKPTIMRNHVDENTFSIVIGDSVTDFEAAKNANLVLARDILIEKCKELNVPYKPFTTFYDCLHVLEGLLEEIA